MNSLMSMGMHHRWRKIAVQMTNVLPGSKFIDVCCGTGMITADLARQVGATGMVIGLDFSANMLAIARRRLERWMPDHNVELVQANATAIPFPDNTFDGATIGYGLRNVLEPRQLLIEVKRVVKPGGRVIALEMAKPYLPVYKDLYYHYLHHWVPLLGKILTHNRDAYQYLHDSIISFIRQDEVTAIYRELGFQNIQCSQLTWGIAAVYAGIKPRERGCLKRFVKE